MPPTHRLQQSSKETTCWMDYTSICSESEREREESPSLVQMHTQTIHRPVKVKVHKMKHKLLVQTPTRPTVSPSFILSAASHGVRNVGENLQAKK